MRGRRAGERRASAEAENGKREEQVEEGKRKRSSSSQPPRRKRRGIESGVWSRRRCGSLLPINANPSQLDAPFRPRIRCSSLEKPSTPDPRANKRTSKRGARAEASLFCSRIEKEESMLSRPRRPIDTKKNLFARQKPSPAPSFLASARASNQHQGQALTSAKLSPSAALGRSGAEERESRGEKEGRFFARRFLMASFFEEANGRTKRGGKEKKTRACFCSFFADQKTLRSFRRRSPSLAASASTFSSLQAKGRAKRGFPLSGKGGSARPFRISPPFFFFFAKAAADLIRLSLAK